MAVSTRPPLGRTILPAAQDRAARAELTAGRAGPALLTALLAAVAYAAFAQGATTLPQETWLQIGLAALTVAGAAAWLWDGGLRVRAPAYAWAGLGLLVAFAAWSALSLLWSVAGENTWIELNRAFAYALVLALALAAGSSHPRALERLGAGYLVIAALVALYAFGGKAVPGVHVDGLFDLDQTDRFSRLRAPLDYWNALALFCALGVPIGLRFAVAARARAARLGSAAAVYLLLTVIGLTYSRGGIVAMLVGIAAALALGGRGRILRSLWTFAAALAASAAPIATALAQPALTADHPVPLALREAAGIDVLYAFLGGLALVLALAWAVGAVAGRLGWRPAWERWVRRLSWALAGLVALVVIAAIANGSAGRAIDSFTSDQGASISDPARVLSVDSGHRWTWWKEAMGAFSARPAEGWGAGSFPVTHLLYRHNVTPVQQPHSVPVQFLAETGIVGFLLGFGACVLLVGGALWTVRRMDDDPPAPPRALAAALAGGGLAWLVHGLVDWDWDMPGVTVPALLFLGVVAARGGLPAGGPRVAAWGTATRTVVLGGATALMCLLALSAGLPAWSAAKADTALASLGRQSSAARLQAAASSLGLAASLDPLADQPLINAAAVAQRRERLIEARDLLLSAAQREPYDATVWARLASIEFERQDAAGYLRAARAALARDPENPFYQRLVAQAEGFQAPLNQSPSARGTPLPVTVALPAGG